MRLFDTGTRAVEAVFGDEGSRQPSGTDTVAIVGMGYVGLPTALSLVETGVRVIGLDISERRLGAIEAGAVDLVPSDQARLVRWRDTDAFSLSHDFGRLDEASHVIVCVPTPVDEHRHPDLTALRGACATVVARAVAGQTILLTSTTFVGSTAELLVDPLRARGFVPGVDIFVAFAPERIDPGNVRHPQETVPRVVGGYTAACTRRAAELVGRVAPVHRVSSPEAAELTKLYENTFRAVNIALANEFESLSRRLSLDMVEVIHAAATKPFGFMPFFPGTGVGGHCIPCDPHYLLWQLRAMRHEAPLIERAMASITSRPDEIVERVAGALGARGRGLLGSRILVVGAAYKPGVEDVRESPALQIIEELRRRDALVDYYDPLVPALALSDGTELATVTPSDGSDYDAAVIHVVQPGDDVSWLLSCGIIVDPSARAARREPVAIPIEVQEVAVGLGEADEGFQATQPAAGGLTVLAIADPASSTLAG